MLEFAIDALRGSFHLKVECRFASDWTVIFGPSGSGKSTLLRLIAGLDRFHQHRPNSKRFATVRIVLDDETVCNSARGIWSPPGRRHMALVAQQPALFPHLTVAANVAYGLADLDRIRRSARVEEMLELAGAAHLMDRPPRNLSGGEAQRVAIARALAPLPRLLLLDEPFAALDGTASDALLARLQDWLQQQSIQTIIATHDATDAFSTAAEVALMSEGRITGQGPAAQVLSVERERLNRRLQN